MKNNAFALLVLSLFVGSSATAISLGKYRGDVLVGRPLDISVQAVLDAPGALAAQCIEAEVFYADNKLDKSRVQVSAERALSNPLDAVIRIQSSVPIDEPTVTLYVRAGCQQKAERRYVVSADVAAEPSSPRQPFVATNANANANANANTNTGNGRVVSPVAGSNSGVRVTAPSPAVDILPAATAAATLASRSQTQRGATLDGSPEKAVLGLASPLPNQPAKTSAKNSALVENRGLQRINDVGTPDKSGLGKARLKLEPLDLSVEPDVQLKVSTQMVSTPSGDDQRTNAAALWRALSAQPQDVLQNTEKIQSLENALSALRLQSQENQLAIAKLNGQVEQTRSERYANWLVYALGILLLLAICVVFYLWRQRRTARAANNAQLPWWQKNKTDQESWAQDALPPDASAPEVVAFQHIQHNLAQNSAPLAAASEPLHHSGEAVAIGAGWAAKRLFAAHSKAVSKESHAADHPGPLDHRPQGVMQRRSEQRAAPAQEQEQEQKKSSLALNNEFELAPDRPEFTQVQHLSEFGASSTDTFLMPSLDCAATGARAKPAVTIEELLDLQQQTSSLVSLGQNEQAIEVLKKQLLENTPVNAWVCLNLLDIYHQTHQRGSYEALRENCNRLFNKELPVFDLYRTYARLGLEAHPVTLKRIELAWRSPKAVTLIDDFVLHQGTSNGQIFGLQTYRDLLLLRAVAKDLLRKEPEPSLQLSCDFELAFELGFEPPMSAAGSASEAGGVPAQLATDFFLPTPAFKAPAFDNTGLPPPPPPPKVDLDLDLDFSDLPPAKEEPPLNVQPLPTRSRPNSNFFARLGKNFPAAPSDRSAVAAVSPAPAAPAVADTGNMIDFGEFKPAKKAPGSGITTRPD